jgi:hypothetical protein
MHIQRRALLLAALWAPLVARAGAWGPGSFENDDALDWVADCVESKGPQAIAAALAQALDAHAVEAPQASSAIAAAEVVAAAGGRPNPKLPSELRGWLQHQSNDEIAKLAPRAVRAIDRIASEPSSELAALWKQSESYAAWQRSMQDLVARLAPVMANLAIDTDVQSAGFRGPAVRRSLPR